MELFVRHTGGVSFEAKTRGQRIVSDQPLDNQGQDSGMTPPELLLASLGTCAGFYALQYLRTRALSSEGLEVKVTAEKAAAPARIGSFHVEVIAPNVAAEHQAGILRSVKACLIHNTLTHPPAIEMEVRTNTADMILAG